MIKIFDKYPPLTSRLFCSLSFLKSCIVHKDVNIYLSTRNLKYSNQNKIIQSRLEENLVTNNYFNSWLSGFIEAEGCFSIRKNNYAYFSIAQMNDIYILHQIKIYFNATNKIRKPYKDKQLYSLEIYKKDSLQKIIDHCEDYPLLGDKYNSLLKFKNSLNSLPSNTISNNTEI
jgi:hypothetical protein